MIHFSEKEFACCPACNLGFSNMDYDLINLLDRARGYAEVAFIVTSSIRCQAHNKAVGGSETSSHLKGLAVDIKCVTSYTRYQILTGLRQAGFNRLGVGPDFVHCDIDEDKPKNLMWVY